MQSADIWRAHAVKSRIISSYKNLLVFLVAFFPFYLQSMYVDILVVVRSWKYHYMERKLQRSGLLNLLNSCFKVLSKFISCSSG